MSGTYMFAQVRRAAPSFSPLLQRKCLCTGQQHAGGQSVAQQQRGSALHDFSRVRVHASGTPFFFIPEASASSRVKQGATGDTGCDVSKGEPDVVIHAPSLCYRSCTERHEEIHRTDIRPCCQKAHAKWTVAKTDDKKNAVQDKMNDWVAANNDTLQCRAYAESVRCADEFLKANCGAKKEESEQPGKEKTANPPAVEPGQEMAGGPEDVAGKPGVARVANDPSKDKPSFKPEICCSTVKEYRRKSDLRGQAFCKTGKKGLSTCPF